jgi:coatomer subunit beta
MREIRKVLGEIPILASEQRLLDEASGNVSGDGNLDEEGGESKEKEKEKAAATRPKVLADGTYATETAFTSAGAVARLEAVKSASKPPLRSESQRLSFSNKLLITIILLCLALILGGDFFTASVLASALTKLILRFVDLSTDAAASNALKAETMLIMTSIIRVGQSKFVTIQIDEDSNERIHNCIQSLSELDLEGDRKVVKEMFLDDTKKAFEKMLGAQEVCCFSVSVMRGLCLGRRRLVETCC